MPVAICQTEGCTWERSGATAAVTSQASRHERVEGHEVTIAQEGADDD